MIARLCPNRVRRTYLGGGRIDAFTGFVPEKDGALRPEDWMASTVTAFNGTVEIDGEDWAAKARHWGMKYVVFTTRHHDGFAMWDSAVNPFNAKRLGPKRDILGELVPALKTEGLKVGFYYMVAVGTLGVVHEKLVIGEGRR